MSFFLLPFEGSYNLEGKRISERSLDINYKFV